MKFQLFEFNKDNPFEVEDCSWSVWQIHKGGDPLFGLNWICRKSCSGSEIIICSRLLQLFVRLWSPSGLEWPLSSSSSLFSSPSLPSPSSSLLSPPSLILYDLILYYICEAWISVGALEWTAPTLLLFSPSYSPFSHVLLSSFFLSFFWSGALSFPSSLAVFFSFYSLFFGELPYPTLLLSSSLLFSSRGVLLLLFFLVFSDILERWSHTIDSSLQDVNSARQGCGVTQSQ